VQVETLSSCKPLNSADRNPQEQEQRLERTAQQLHAAKMNNSAQLHLAVQNNNISSTRPWGERWGGIARPGVASGTPAAVAPSQPCFSGVTRVLGARPGAEASN